MIDCDPILSAIILLIRQSGVFPDATEECTVAIAKSASWMSVYGGMNLFEQGEDSDAIYITSSGLLGAYVLNGSGVESLVGRIGRGELIGEMGCVAGEPRSTTIRALRTSEVLMVPWSAVEPLAKAHPALMLSLSRTVIRRMRDLVDGKAPHVELRTYCFLPSINDEDTRSAIGDIVDEFSKIGSTFIVRERNRLDYTTEQLAALENKYRYVVYVADSGRTPWTRLCLRQADTVIIVGSGEQTPSSVEMFGEIGAGIPINLVLLWQGTISLGKTAPWLDRVSPRLHLHIRSRRDTGRAARLLTGTGTGIVLAGGGARGLAHVGVVKALTESGIAIDAVIGTSVGALIGSSIALEWDYERSRAAAHRFSRKHPILELVIPLRSLLSGRNLQRSLKEWHGETRIEETPVPFACVSACLNTNTDVVHKRGKLETWVRASASLPGIFPPVLEDGALYVDGGVINNLPTDTIQGMGVGFVIGVELQAGSKGKTLNLPSIIETLLRVATMGSNARTHTAREQCDVLLNPGLETIDLMNFRAYDIAITAGYDCALRNIEQIKRLISDKDAASRHSAAPLAGLTIATS